jgi:4-alpha-glucanotransferase
VRTELGRLPFIAEDLGLITPDVRYLRDQFQVPGTRVLQFAFDGHADNPYLPHNFVPNTVVYTGTHDNAPTREWYEELPTDQRNNLWSYLKRAPPGESAEVAAALMGLGWSSVAALAIAPLQDLLNLGKGTRMNVPGRPDGNWSWRSTEDMISPAAFESIRALTERSGRSAVSGIAPISKMIEAVS